MSTATELPADEFVAEVAYSALREAGRPDLANLVAVYIDDDGTPYIEPMDELVGADLALVERAEALALEALTRTETRP